MDEWIDENLARRVVLNNPVIHLSTNPIGELVEPEVVATSPYPIKSRVPVCCGFSSTKETLDAWSGGVLE